MKRSLRILLLTVLGGVLATGMGLVVRQVIIVEAVYPQLTREGRFLYAIGQQVLLYQQTAGCGDILYDPSKFAAWCREHSTSKFDCADLCDVAVPMVLRPHPEAAGWDKDDRRFQMYAVVFMPGQMNRILLRALWWPPVTSFYGKGYGNTPGRVDDKSSYDPRFDHTFLAFPADHTLRPGEREADDFFKAAAGMWQAAARKDRSEFLAVRDSFKASDTFAGLVDGVGVEPFILSGEQLEAMAMLLDEKVFRSIESTASR